MRLLGYNLFALFLVATLTAAASAQHDHNMNADVSVDPFDQETALEISQAVIGSKPGHHTFTDSNGKAVSLSDYQGRPVAIAMIYTSCPHTCPTIIQSLEDRVTTARAAVGADNLTVLTIGFDTTNDTPKRMKHYRGAQGITHKDWHFLSTDAATIETLAADLGFIYKETPYGFDHLAQVTLLDRDGFVRAQVYGEKVPTPQFVEPLKQIVFGKKANLTSFTGLVNQVRLFCTIYNPNTGKYQFDYSLIIMIVIGLASSTLVGVFLVRGFLRQ